jgi:hypothetical protein
MYRLSSANHSLTQRTRRGQGYRVDKLLGCKPRLGEQNVDPTTKKLFSFGRSSPAWNLEERSIDWAINSNAPGKLGYGLVARKRIQKTLATALAVACQKLHRRRSRSVIILVFGEKLMSLSPSGVKIWRLPRGDRSCEADTLSDEKCIRVVNLRFFVL